MMGNEKNIFGDLLAWPVEGFRPMGARFGRFSMIRRADENPPFPFSVAIFEQVNIRTIPHGMDSGRLAAIPARWLVQGSPIPATTA
jgi:hypothetical protein